MACNKTRDLMPLARLEIELYGEEADLTLRYVKHRGEVVIARDDEAWTMLYRIFPVGRLEGTLEHIRNQYILQCMDDGLDIEETATRLGASVRGVRNWAKAVEGEFVRRSPNGKYPDALRREATARARAIGIRPAAREMGLPKSVVASWLDAEHATVHLAPHAQEAYEERALRPTGTDD